MSRTFRNVLAATVLALVAASALVSAASASNFGLGVRPTYYGGGFMYGPCC
jgi:hypothetical protein